MDQKTKQAVSGPGLERRIAGFLQAGEVWVQGINRKAGHAVLPEFAMWPALAATAVLSCVIAWHMASACEVLGDVVRSERENRKIHLEENVSVEPSMGRRLPAPGMVPGRF